MNVPAKNAKKKEPAVLENTVVLTKAVSLLDKLQRWSFNKALWPIPFATSCCALEYQASMGAKYDFAGLGGEVISYSPRHADLMIVLGTITTKMLPVLLKVYEQMPSPKLVMAVGACATSGGLYNSYGTIRGIGEYLPVAVYVPGCPPTPEAIMRGFLEIKELIQKRGLEVSATK